MASNTQMAAEEIRPQQRSGATRQAPNSATDLRQTYGWTTAAVVRGCFLKGGTLDDPTRFEGPKMAIYTVDKTAVPYDSRKVASVSSDCTQRK